MATRIIRNSNDMDSGGVVAAADELFLAEGSIKLDTNIDQSLLGANGLDSMFVAPKWTADIGDAGAPLQAEFSSAADSLFEYSAGGGRCFYYANGDADVCDKLRVNNRGEMNLVTGGTITILECLGAGTNVFAPVIVPTLWVAGTGRCEMHDAASTDPTTVNVGGSGTLVMDRGATTINQFGAGQISMRNPNDNAVTTWNMYGGSTSLLRCGTITTLNWYGGSFDARMLQAPTAITTLNYLAGNVDQAALDDVLNSRVLTIGTSLPIGKK